MKKTIIFIIIGILFLKEFELINQYFFLSKLSKNELSFDKVYYYDLDGDGSSEKIKLEKSKDENDNDSCRGNLYINDKLRYQYEGENASAYICDFNKIDSNKELCIVSGNNIENLKTNIFMYEDDNNQKNYEIKGKIINNDDKNGLIKITNGSTENSDIFKLFYSAIGEHININYNYKRVVESELIDMEEKSVEVVGVSKEKEYIVKDEIKVYETNTGNVEAYTLYKDDIVRLTSLYSYGENKCIKVVNKEGRYGWIKITDNQLFT